MKNTLLLKATVLGAASALTIGAAAVPFVSFASEPSSANAAQHDGPRGNQPGRGMMGPHGTVTSIDDRGDGTGTITLTLAVPERPEGAPELDASALEKIEARMEAFFEAHPDAPRPGDSMTVAYDSTTKFMIGGKEASAADVTVGMSMFAMGVKPESGEAAKLITDAARPPRSENGPRGERPRGMVGEVVNVDTDANTVTITLPDDSDGTFSVGQQVHVGAFAQVNLGDHGSEE
jgi:hypothetical protein